MTTDLSEKLGRRLGLVPAAVLLDWAAVNRRTVRLPAVPWEGQGFTDARLVTIFVSGARAKAQLLVVKYLPPSQVAEFRAHRRALEEAPLVFADHFVGQAFQPVPVTGGGLLTFQELAGHSRDWRPMAEVPIGQLAGACAAVTTALIADWNIDHTTIMEMTVAEFIGREMGIGRKRLHVATKGYCSLDPTLPDPLTLFRDDSPGGRLLVDLVCGRVHGDLHDGNVLMRQHDGQPDVEPFVIVDLMTYASSGPLSRDPVRLLLSAVIRLWRVLSDPQRRLLLGAVVRPDRPPSRELPGVVADILAAVYGSAAALLLSCGVETWRWQSWPAGPRSNSMRNTACRHRARDRGRSEL